MATVFIDAPVGLRWNQVNVTNYQEDQQRIIGLLSRIPASNGGKKEAWPAPILAGGDGQCSSDLLTAIWDFQKHWKQRGVFKNIDGVVDPNGHTLFRLNLLAGGGETPPGPTPEELKPVIRNDRVPGTWQVTNVWSLNLGEVGMVGGAKVEVTQPDNKKFEMAGAGAGVGYGIDPITWGKALKDGIKVLNPMAGAAEVALKPLLESLAKGVGFSIGDYIQLLGGSLTSLTKGVLIANPINNYVGRPTAVSRYMITEGGNANFAIASLGGGIGFGGEGGLLGFGGPAVGPTMLLCPVLGCYGALGATAKFGASAQVMMYFTTAVSDK
jgi:hypothetical protein